MARVNKLLMQFCIVEAHAARRNPTKSSMKKKSSLETEEVLCYYAEADHFGIAWYVHQAMPTQEIRAT